MKYGVAGKGLGAEQRSYLDKKLLENIVDNTMWDKFATITKQLPLGNTQTVEFNKKVRSVDLYFANNLNAQFTDGVIDVAGNNTRETLQLLPENAYQDFILAEGSSGESKAKIKWIRSSANVFVIGDWMPYSEEMKLFHNLWDVAESAKDMGEMAGEIVDAFYRDLYKNGAGHVADMSAVDVSDSQFTEAVRKIVVKLRLSGAKPTRSVLSNSVSYGTVPVRARYFMIVHTIVGEALQSNPKFVPIEKYTTKHAEIGGAEEVGILGECVVFVNHNAPLKATPTAGEYLADVIIFGQDHSAQVPVRGKTGAEFIYKGLGDGGSKDALNRAGTVGWKSWLGAKVLYPERLAKITVKVQY